MYLNTNIKSECYGCSACEQICSHNAISMKQDSDGFYYPEVNIDKCTNCGLCERVCPYNTDTDLSPIPQVYAAYAKKENERIGSSSGALFYILAKTVIAEGGIVYGAIMDVDCQVYHRPAESLEELQSLRGSKYVQSKLNDTFRSIRNHLRNGRIVYFVGTGCQVAGLRSFLLKKYDNLITSDLVCHGVPPQKLFDEHIRYLEKKYNGKVVEYAFRDNLKWGGCEIVDIKKHNSNTKRFRLPSYDLSPYLYSFMNAMTCRDSCYECAFAKIPRCGDITLADFWGAKDYYPQIDASRGISLVLLNSTLGTKWFDKIRDQIFCIESTIEIAAAQNKNLVQHTNKPDIRNHIFSDIQKYGYECIAHTVFKAKGYVIKKLTYKLIESIGRENYQKIRNFFK